jgi:hypothetical protein
MPRTPRTPRADFISNVREGAWFKPLQAPPEDIAKYRASTATTGTPCAGNGTGAGMSQQSTAIIRRMLMADWATRRTISSTAATPGVTPKRSNAERKRAASCFNAG